MKLKNVVTSVKFTGKCQVCTSYGDNIAISHSPPQELPKKKDREKEALPHNLSTSDQVGSEVAFFQMIITG